ncbi:MAG: phosphoesterase [Gemmataceae bacterium]|nr:phosphoesterase [Gemmataceae bacterium]MCI0743207.1 phosphoesterase [Gemmataceae bacterium]
MVEQVLVIPTAILRETGMFHGLTLRHDYYLPRLLQDCHLAYMPRPSAEEDPRFKQIIPYVVLRHGDRVFHYLRGQGGGEKRLRSLRSVGVGGHINPGDSNSLESTACACIDGEVYRQGMLREVAEEIYLESDYHDSCLGLINDDSTPVGQVHLGIVHVFDLRTPNVRRREKVLTASGFAPIQELRAQKDEFETWSQFVLDALAETQD